MVSSKRSRRHQAYSASSPATLSAMTEASTRFSGKEAREEQLRKDAQNNASDCAARLYHTQLASYTGGRLPENEMIYIRDENGTVKWDYQRDVPLVYKQFGTNPQVEPLEKFAAPSQERPSLVTQNLIHSGQNSHLSSQESTRAVMEGVIRSTANAQSNRNRFPVSQTSRSRQGNGHEYMGIKDNDEEFIDSRLFGKEDSTAFHYTGGWQPGNISTHWDYRIEMNTDLDGM